MKITIVQCGAEPGNLEKNIQAHVEYSRKIAEMGGEIIMFPELSLTGYEPTLASSLATDKENPVFQPLLKLSTSLNITICAGMPLRSDNGITISMLIFQPGELPGVYSKQFLHDDEVPFFVPAAFQPTSLTDLGISLAICYEISIASHSEASSRSNSSIYLSSVVKYPKAMKTAYKQLSEIASKHRMLVLMSNAVGLSEGNLCGGLSGIWNEEGKLLAQLDDKQEGALIIDTDTRKITTLFFD